MNTQIEKEIDDRFTAAVDLLKSDETSVRTDAIYSLYQQAVECEKYREEIVEELCSHICSKTRESDDQEQHKDRPSNEIQTAIDLLFRETESKGLYFQFGQDFPNADLSCAYCARADFSGAHFQGAHFYASGCEGADFAGANCQEANFEESNCQQANFGRASCQGGDFEEAYCEGVDFGEAYCQGIYFVGAYCQGVNFMEASCQGAYISSLSQSLKDRIGENTKLEELVLEGALSEQSIDAIEKSKEYCALDWYPRMQKIIEANKSKEEKRGTPDGIVSGILKDSTKLQKIIKFLKNIKESKENKLD